jgi:hypothetical protein
MLKFDFIMEIIKYLVTRSRNIMKELRDMQKEHGNNYIIRYTNYGPNVLQLLTLSVFSHSYTMLKTKTRHGSLSNNNSCKT